MSEPKICPTCNGFHAPGACLNEVGASEGKKEAHEGTSVEAVRQILRDIFNETFARLIKEQNLELSNDALSVLATKGINAMIAKWRRIAAVNVPTEKELRAMITAGSETAAELEPTVEEIKPLLQAAIRETCASHLAAVTQQLKSANRSLSLPAMAHVSPLVAEDVERLGASTPLKLDDIRAFAEKRTKELMEKEEKIPTREEMIELFRADMPRLEEKYGAKGMRVLFDFSSARRDDYDENGLTTLCVTGKALDATGKVVETLEYNYARKGQHPNGELSQTTTVSLDSEDADGIPSSEALFEYDYASDKWKSRG